jgi:hypothetical protein
MIKNYYTNIDMGKMMCHYIDNMAIKVFSNDSKMFISNLIWVSTNKKNYGM